MGFLGLSYKKRGVSWWIKIKELGFFMVKVVKNKGF